MNGNLTGKLSKATLKYIEGIKRRQVSSIAEMLDLSIHLENMFQKDKMVWTNSTIYCAALQHCYKSLMILYESKIILFIFFLYVLWKVA